MKSTDMINMLQQAYEKPTQKFCFFTGENNARISKALGLKQWDWTPQPTVNIEPFYWNTHTIALAFGCKAVKTSEGREWIEPLITDPSQVEDIEIPEIYAGRTGEILNLAKKMAVKFPEDSLIRLPDIQSPLGVCELMWDTNFYLALLTNPVEMKVLLEKITTFTIRYIKEFQHILGARYNPACHPQLWSDPMGYYISDDANSMVSPEMHKALCIDPINRITEECGPVFYHSCTFTDPYIGNIQKVKNVKAMNWSTGTSMDPARIIDIFSGKTMLAPHLGKGIHLEEGITHLGKGFRDEVDVFAYYLESMIDNTTMNIVIHEDLMDDEEKVKRIYRLFRDFGYTPQDAGF